jgi:hypothetical protein
MAAPVTKDSGNITVDAGTPYELFTTGVAGVYAAALHFISMTGDIDVQWYLTVDNFSTLVWSETITPPTLGIVTPPIPVTNGAAFSVVTAAGSTGTVAWEVVGT